ncbi:NMD protein affecting ribosome stability and mRNA decay [Sulfolobales archaeon SCGC AB-777_K20]|nr:NMD protein affecting ribosome stability and mRNA decay [Sulfolobales archaeon SCGC AB-777_K20]
MEMASKFCVRCGKTDVPLVDGRLCAECYVKHRLAVEIPSEVKGKICKLCGSMWISGKWIKPETENPLREYIWKLVVPRTTVDRLVKTYEISVERLWRDAGNRTHAVILLTGDLEGHRFEVRKDVLLDISKTLCNECMNKKTGYYEAKVQLRFKERRLDEDKRAFFESFITGQYMGALTNVIEGKEGVDYYFASKSAAKNLIASFLAHYGGAEVKETFESEKVKDGKRVAKLVISVRL